MAYKSLSEIWSHYDVVEKKQFSSHELIQAISEIPKDSEEAVYCRYEALAFDFVPRVDKSEWRTYYHTQWTFTKKDTGEEVNIPDIKDINADILDYWEARAIVVVNPLLKMRYTGLVFDFKKKITGERPDFKSICLANIRAIIDVVKGDYAEHDLISLYYAERGLELAILFEKIELQREVVAVYYDAHKRLATDDMKPGLWSCIFHSLIQHRTVFGEYEDRIVEENKERLYRIEAKALSEGNQTDRYVHVMNDQVDILCEYYHSISEDGKIEGLLDRLLAAIKLPIAVRGGLWGQGMLGQVQAKYRKYNLDVRANKLFVDKQALGQRTLKEMKPVEISIPIDGKVINAFLDDALSGTLNEALNRYIYEYIPNRKEEIRRQKENAEKYPLMDMVATMTIDSCGNTITHVGVGKDADEQKLHFSMYENMRITTPMMHLHMGELRKRKALKLEDLLNLFDGSPIINEGNRPFYVKGLEAYLDEDNLVCCHLLIPQFEAAVRLILASNGANVLRPKGDPKEGNEYYSLYTLLELPDAKECFKEDLITYFKVLFTSQSGWNLRNLVSHGLLPADSFSYVVADRVVHAILILSQFKLRE